MSIDSLRREFKELEEALTEMESNPSSESVLMAIKAHKELADSVRSLRLPFDRIKGDDVPKVIQALNKGDDWSITDPANRVLRENFVSHLSDLFSEHGTVTFMGQPSWQSFIEFLLTAPSGNRFLGKNIKVRLDVLLGGNAHAFIVHDYEPIMRIGIGNLASNIERAMDEFNYFRNIANKLMVNCIQIPHKGRMVSAFPTNNEAESIQLKEAIYHLKGVLVDVIQRDDFHGVCLQDAGVLV